MTRRKFCALAPATLAAAGREAEDEYGGRTVHQLGAKGRFRIERWRNGYWLVTPKGHPLSVAGLCHAQMPPPEMRVPGDTTTQKFGNDPQRYARDVVEWMRGAGFNTFSYGVPAAAEQDMNRLAELGLVPGFINGPKFPDFFDPAWRAEAATKIARLAPVAARDPRVIGYVLSNPLLFSPQMERPGIWRNGAVKRQNYMMAVRSLPAGAPAKQAYVDYLRRTYQTADAYARRRNAPAAPRSFDDLLSQDLAVNDDYLILHPDDARFYTHMWSDMTSFIVKEIRKHDPAGLIFSYRFIRVLTWPDPWLEAMLAGVGPHVDAFAVELYSDNPYRAAVDGIGAKTGKPSLILDGMRKLEFVYSDQADDRLEAAEYERMYRALLASPWFLGSCVCEYRQKLPGNPEYSPRPKEGRLGVRNADYTERKPILAAFRKLHFSRYAIRNDALGRLTSRP